MKKLILLFAILSGVMAEAQGLGMGIILKDEVGFSMSVDWRNVNDLKGTEYFTGVEGGIYGRQQARAEGYYANCSSYSCYSGYSDGITADGEGGWFLAGRYLVPTNKGKIVLAAGPQFHNTYAGGYKQDSNMKVYGKVGYAYAKRSIGYEIAATTVGAFVGMYVKLN